MRDNARLVFFGYEVSAFQAGLVIVGAFFRAPRQFHFFLGYLFVGNETQEMRNTVEARLFLVV